MVQQKGFSRRDDLKPRAGLPGAQGQKIGKVACDPAGNTGQVEVKSLKATVDCKQAKVWQARKKVVTLDPVQGRGAGPCERIRP